MVMLERESHACCSDLACALLKPSRVSLSGIKELLIINDTATHFSLLLRCRGLVASAPIAGKEHTVCCCFLSSAVLRMQGMHRMQRFA